MKNRAFLIGVLAFLLVVIAAIANVWTSNEGDVSTVSEAENQNEGTESPSDELMTAMLRQVTGMD